MTNPFLQKSAGFFRTYSLWILPLLLLTLILRIGEHFSAANTFPDTINGMALFYGLVNDAGFTLSISFFLFAPLCLLWCWKPKLSFSVFVLMGMLYVLTLDALSRYYLTTHTLLGADLFGYTLKDIQTTVASSASFGFGDLFFLLLLPAFVYLLYTLRRKMTATPAWLTAVLLTAGLGSTFCYNSFTPRQGNTEESLSLSKGAYFVSSNLRANAGVSSEWQLAEYPLLHNDNSSDALTPYIELNEEKPNLVFLIIEGLGRDFTGPSASYGGFTPFLDSLSQKGLYWSNFLSSAGRSFAGLPSIFGSLPYGKNGFNELGPQMPLHHTLVSLLKENAYRTNFFYGGNANFDRQDVFLETQNIDFILDENKFGPGYKRNTNNNKSWGYPDGEVYRRSLELIEKTPAQPLLNIYFTLSTHEPFDVPDNALYEQKINQYISSLPETDRQRYLPYKEVWKSLLYSDESIRQFFTQYVKRPDYANTIFVITGDHRLIPVPEDSRLSRFHVPLLIYSPLVKQQKVFPALSSHLDITPSLVQLLRHYPGMHLPADVHWMGKGLDTASQFHAGYEVPLMRNKNTLEDYIHGTSFLSGNQVYRITEGLQIEPAEGKTHRHLLQKKLDSFQHLNQYVCRQNKLMKPGAATAANHVQAVFPPTEEKQIDALTGGAVLPDSLFAKARRLAFAGNQEQARLLCRKALAISPNYHDVRILFGRTYAWEKNYALAVPAFAEVVRRSPGYEDAYLAWIDAETWAGKKDSALLLVKKALTYLPGSSSLHEKKSKLLGSK